MDDPIKTKQLDNQTFRDVYKKLSLLAKNMFIWKNLPDSVNERFLERLLYENGKLVFFKHETLGYVISRCTTGSALNYYEEPTEIQTVSISTTLTPKSLKASECVIIRNNDDEIPTRESIILFTSRISNTQRTIDVNVNNQKTPFIILCDETQRLTLMNLFKKWDGNEPFIFGDKSLKDTLDSIKIIKTDAPYIADKLMKYKHDIMNECFTDLGINNVNTDKRERLITNEVDANNEQIEFSALIMLNSRKRACKLINKMFPDLNIDVELRDINMYKNPENNDIINLEDKEGDTNE